MAISRTIEYKHIENLKLDPLNPRLGRDKRKAGLSQDELLVEMSKWTLDELVDSFAQAGTFWTQDALIIISDETAATGEESFVVIEGNRRVSALKLLYGAVTGTINPPRWLLERLETFKPSAKDPLSSPSFLSFKLSPGMTSSRISASAM
jgi:hypothetical protein